MIKKSKISERPIFGHQNGKMSLKKKTDGNGNNTGILTFHEHGI